MNQVKSLVLSQYQVLGYVFLFVILSYILSMKGHQ